MRREFKKLVRKSVEVVRNVSNAGECLELTFDRIADGNEAIPDFPGALKNLQ
ncbi:hypothetical protein [Bradyrhizobium cytisi]|uniref:hypothetical protein n=1 Tax=Bradyrhizobium cytisi TaxID=515489 RepID=UPI001652F9CF|nr:hypothetical protein [Bradyrhizobium cytisi]